MTATGDYAVLATPAPTSTGGGGGIAVAPAAAPSVSAVSPSGGPAGTTVTITGTAFTGASAVSFGATAATSFTVDSDTQLTAVAPAGTGTVDVTVTTPAGTSATSAADRFTYTAPATAFSDVPSSYWALADIQALVKAGVIDGFPDGTFRPEDAVTRAQFVKMLVVTLGIQSGGAQAGFSDVEPSDWFAPYVAAAVQAHLVQGTSPPTFAPDATLTREQMAVLLARALKLTAGTSLRFTDSGSIDAWATAGVQEAVAAGYLDGFPAGSFQPLGAATRAQAAKVLAMVFSGALKTTSSVTAGSNTGGSGS